MALLGDFGIRHGISVGIYSDRKENVPQVRCYDPDDEGDSCPEQ